MIMIKKDRRAKNIAHNAQDSGPETHTKRKTKPNKMNPERDLGEMKICSLLYGGKSIRIQKCRIK